MNFVEDCIIKSYMYVFLIKILIIIKNNFFNKDGIILYIYLCVYYFSLVKIFNIFWNRYVNENIVCSYML